MELFTKAIIGLAFSILSGSSTSADLQQIKQQEDFLKNFDQTQTQSIDRAGSVLGTFLIDNKNINQTDFDSPLFDITQNKQADLSEYSELESLGIECEGCEILWED